MVFTKIVKRGELYYADLTPVVGSEQGGVRPVMIIQNDVGNRRSPTTIICIITSQQNKTSLPTHVYLGKRFGLTEESFAFLEQVRTIDKARLKSKIGVVDDEIISLINNATHISLALP